MRRFVVFDKEKKKLASFRIHHQLVNSCPLLEQKGYADQNACASKQGYCELL